MFVYVFELGILASGLGYQALCFDSGLMVFEWLTGYGLFRLLVSFVRLEGLCFCISFFVLVLLSPSLLYCLLFCFIYLSISQA